MTSNIMKENRIENGERSIIKDIRIGDLVELLVDGKFFGRNDGNFEAYAGYVASITESIIGISATHPSNLRHGHFSGREQQKQHITEIEAALIRKYAIPTNFYL